MKYSLHIARPNEDESVVQLRASVRGQRVKIGTEALEERGFLATIARGYEEAVAIVTEYLA